MATPYRKRHYASRASLRALSPGAFLFSLLAVLLVPSLATGDEEARLRRTVETLSAPDSRMTGYPGAAVAREWLVAELESLGIAEIYRHEFPVLVPIDEGFWLECAGERLELFGVWPNLVRTPTLPAEGIEGQLVYGGDGSRLEGQPVAGRIVLLDYVSGTAWVDAFHLGAAAVVFLESAGAHRKEAEQKFLDVPADLPRLYARKDVAERLRVLARSRAQVRLRGRMAWREVIGAELGRRDSWARCDAEGGGCLPCRALRRHVAGASVSAGGRAGGECGGAVGIGAGVCRAAAQAHGRVAVDGRALPEYGGDAPFRAVITGGRRAARRRGGGDCAFAAA